MKNSIAYLKKAGAGKDHKLSMRVSTHTTVAHEVKWLRKVF